MIRNHPARLIVSLGLMALLGGCAYYNTLFNAKNHYEEGIKVMRKQATPNGQVPSEARNHFETTIEKCWKLIELYTDENGYADDALLYISKSEYYLQHYTQAKQHLEKFRGKYPDSDLLPDVNLWYAKVLLKEEQVEEANEYLRRVITNSDEPKIRAEANFELGLYAFENGEYEQSIDFLNRALKEKIDDEYKALLLHYLGESYYIQGDYKEAIKKYRDVEKYAPTIDIEYRTRLHLAYSYTETGEFEKAEEVLRKMRTAPRFQSFQATIETAIGRNLQAEGFLDDAILQYKEVVRERRKTEGTADAAFRLGRIYENQLANLDSAVVYYGQVREFYANHDSVEVAVSKDRFLREYRDIRGQIRNDERLVYRLTTDPFFRDSLYQAQYDDSVRTALGLQPDTTGDGGAMDVMDSLWMVYGDSIPEAILDSLDRVATIDSLTRLGLPIPDSLRVPRDDLAEEEGDPEDPDPDADDPFADNSFRNSQDDPFNTEPDSRRTDPRNRGPNQPRKEERPLERRKLPEIKDDLMRSYYQLAEFYLLKVEAYDSALVHYHSFLDTYQDSVLTPKAIYSLRYIYRTPALLDSARADSLEQVILDVYPESVFAREIRRAMGEVVREAAADSNRVAAEARFKHAERLYFDGNVDDALDLYQGIASIDTTWELSAKAQFATAWIYEHDLNAPEKALDAYRELADRYPSARDYVQRARNKTTEVTNSVFGMPDSAFADSSLAFDTGGNEGVDAGSDGIAIKLEDILEEKIMWRIRRDNL